MLVPMSYFLTARLDKYVYDKCKVDDHGSQGVLNRAWLRLLS
jgi:hypothetical protein